jgi:seryl-tRNA synthetase
MLDPNLIRREPERVKQNILERNFNPERANVDRWLEVDKVRSKLLQELSDTNRRKNELAEMGKSSTDMEALRQTGKEIKESVRRIETELQAVEPEWKDLLAQIPNMHFAEVPIGKDDSANVELRKVGTIPRFDFQPKDHVELGKELDIIDFDAGSKVSGSQFYFLKNDAVMLELALLQFGMEFFQKHGFELIVTPDMAKSRFYLGTGYAPRGDEAQIYEIEGEDLGLIATAEVTMAGLYADEVLDHSQLPLKYAAYSHCFRKEAGAYGKYSKGLYRVHQFGKLEMFVYCTPEQSQAIHLELLAIEEEILQALQIPYRVLEMCSGDLGGMAARKFDLEAWMPGRSDYGEVTSTSNCTDFQARNLNIRYKNAQGENDYLHMLNGTAIVMSRIPIAIIENYQQADGTIRVPEVLQKYMGKAIISN